MRKLFVFYDNWCPNCTRFIKIITKLDWFHLIIPKKLRIHKYDQCINYEIAKQKMASTIDHKKWIYGYGSLYAIFIRIPACWVFVPFFYVLKVTTLGDYFYNELAVKRKVIPLHCDENCEI